MQKILIPLFCFALGGGLTWFVIERQRTRDSIIQPSPAPPKITTSDKATPAHKPASSVAPNLDFQKYRSARQAVLNSNPDLQNQYKNLLKKVESQQTKLEASMVKVDPQLAPVIAKLEALRTQNGGPATATQLHSAPDLTQDEWQRLRAARSHAVQSDSALIASNKKLMEEMRTFEDEVNAAIIKAHPDMAPVIAKVQANRQRPGMAVSSPHPK